MKDCPEGMDCGKIHEMLEDILDHELATDVYSEVMKHMKMCPDCTLHVDSVKKVIRLFRVAGETKAPVNIKIDLQDVLARARETEGGTENP